MKPIVAIVAAGLLLVSDFAAGRATAEPAPFMMRARVKGQLVEGQPLIWNKRTIVLHGRSGTIHEFPPQAAKNSQRTSPNFFGYSMREMKEKLYDRYGKQAEITTTQHYIVVHPRGQKSEWADRFEQLYRDFTRYFRVRDFKLEEPDYPLVAVVFPTQAEYIAHATRSGMPQAASTLGFYSYKDNRVYLYDMRNDGQGEWTDNADTIIHEATHQTAFNTGIHTRYSGAPQWVVEGLATMFEARGVYASQSFDSRRDRINAGRHRDFKHSVQTERPGFMAELIATDRPFQIDGATAYADAWALTFFLAETRPRLYAKYLTLVANRPMFSTYTEAERRADFQDIFGNNLRWFEHQFLRFMEEVE